MSAMREELKKKYEELMAVIERFNVLEEALKGKEEELELSKGMEAQYSDLQNQVVQLQGQLDECRFQVEALKGEVDEK